MHQSTTLSLSQTIWPRWASRQFFTLPIVQILLPVTFGYSQSKRKNLPSLWENWGDERGCDDGHWHGHTRGLPWGLPEVVETIQVHCSRTRLLRRGPELHVCTINKSAHTKNVWKLIVCTSYNVSQYTLNSCEWLLITLQIIILSFFFFVADLKIVYFNNY